MSEGDRDKIMGRLPCKVLVRIGDNLRVDPVKCMEELSEVFPRYQKAIATLEKMANTDYRGNRSPESIDAFKCLEELAQPLE